MYSGYDSFNIIKGIDLNVKKGELVAIIGPNGCGKSTILKSIFNLTLINRGKIKFKGEDITNIKPYLLLNLGISFVTQGDINFGNLRVIDNLNLSLDNIEKTRQKSSLKGILKKFPILLEKKEEFAYSLSGGEQQILAIARALLTKPSLILLDEPTLGLSPIAQNKLFDELIKLKKSGTSIIIVEQNVKRALEIADWTYLLENGSVAMSGSKKLLNNKKLKKVYLGG